MTIFNAMFGPRKNVTAIHHQHPGGRLELTSFQVWVPEGAKVEAVFTCTSLGAPVIERTREFAPGDYTIRVDEIFTEAERMAPDTIYFGDVSRRVQVEKSAT